MKECFFSMAEVLWIQAVSYHLEFEAARYHSVISACSVSSLKQCWESGWRLPSGASRRLTNFVILDLSPPPHPPCAAPLPEGNISSFRLAWTERRAPCCLRFLSRSLTHTSFCSLPILCTYRMFALEVFSAAWAESFKAHAYPWYFLFVVVFFGEGRHWGRGKGGCCIEFGQWRRYWVCRYFGFEMLRITGTSRGALISLRWTSVYSHVCLRDFSNLSSRCMRPQ